MADVTPEEGESVSVEPALYIRSLQARYRQALAASAKREAELVEEIAGLEAYVAQQAAQLAELQKPSEPDRPANESDPWNDGVPGPRAQVSH